jgi:gluconate 2-dehydrogenase gamma chain
MMHDLSTLDRRRLVQGIAVLLGVAVLPAEALAAPKRKATRFMPPARYALLSAVADAIIPKTDSVGALDAQVPARFDALLRDWASAETRTVVDGALTRIDTAAMAAKGKGFVALTPVERAEVLTPHDVAALKSAPKPSNAPKGSVFSQIPSVVDQGYYKVKDLVLLLYYYSEPAATSELIYEHVPGKFEPSIKLTATSRPYLGAGGFF